MKKNVCFLLLLLIVTGLSSCKDDENEQELTLRSIQRPTGVSILPGYKRVKITWETPTDPLISTAKISWNQGAETMEVDYKSFIENNNEVYIEGLENKSYTFVLINYDDAGNRSLRVEEIASPPYAEEWLETRVERTVSSAEKNGAITSIVMNSSADNELVSTRFRYVNMDGETVVLEQVLSASGTTISLPDAASGKRFEFSSSYRPANGADAVWKEWSESPDPIYEAAPLLDARSWNVTVTDRQIWNLSTDFDPKLVVDGIIDRTHRWCSANTSPAPDVSKVFPKIMVIDATKIHNIEKVSLYQDPTNAAGRFGKTVEIYWGNTPFDPNVGSSYESSAGFANAITNGAVIKEAWPTTTATWTKKWSELQNFRYFAIVWKDSHAAGGWVDLWEAQFFGYEAAVD